ncbi:MAG: helix-turn-helix transcriptional regulator [Thermomicrobiales bacterium]
MKKIYSPLADWIYRLRTEVYDMTQENFAREVGVAHNTVTRWETDARVPPNTTLKLLATMAASKGFDDPIPLPERISKPLKRGTAED